jgi:hypothetical protein
MLFPGCLSQETILPVVVRRCYSSHTYLSQILLHRPPTANIQAANEYSRSCKSKISTVQLKTTIQEFLSRGQFPTPFHQHY